MDFGLLAVQGKVDWLDFESLLVRWKGTGIGIGLKRVVLRQADRKLTRMKRQNGKVSWVESV